MFPASTPALAWPRSFLRAKGPVAQNLVATGLMGLRSLRENREGSLTLIMKYLSLDAQAAKLTYGGNIGPSRTPFVFGETL